MTMTLERPTDVLHDVVDDATRRGFLGGVLGLGAAALVGCSDTGQTSSQSATGETRIDHTYGSTVVPSKPQRVVSVGDTDQDAILALGVVPVGIRDYFGDQPYAVWPWARDRLGDAAPTVFDASDGLRIEEVAALKPDLIIGTYSAMSQREYDLLSQIAPTVAQSADYPDYGQPWDEITLTIGRALGRESLARDLVAGVRSTFAGLRRAHPEFAGRTAVVGSVSGAEYVAYTSTDSAARFLASLGFENDPAIDTLAKDAGVTGVVSVSGERLDLFDRDIALWYETRDEAATLLESKVYTGLDVHREGRDVFLGYEPLGGALAFSTVLSLPYAAEKIVPMLAEALAD
ncbi:iron-siderophore ABC transporter substrate-binding protein [Nocardioides sp. R-C-SC26]|uniref:iron-siderophore ABC transporter substrate-binding protein n=1 Tax=Nocardioides sp. R-C-SC26 TaxID=2870414 RepID=UPI001E4D1F4A|nr:iron-siderophore ABC transporter substrate-binding protein [Nocardioides sp. R-C-SC26]